MLTAREIADAVLSGRPIPADVDAVALGRACDGAVEMKFCEGFNCGRNFVRVAIGAKELRKKICPACENKKCTP